MSEQRRALHQSSRRSNWVEQRVAGVAAALADRADELVGPLAEGIIQEGRQSGLAVCVAHDRRLRVHAANDPCSIMAATKAERRGVPCKHAVSRYEATIGRRGMQHGTERCRAREITHTIARPRGDVEQKVDET